MRDNDGEMIPLTVPRCHQFIGNNQDQVSLWRDIYLGGGESVEALRLRRLEQVDVVEGGEVVGV